MKSMENIKLTEDNTGEVYNCKPTQEFNLPFGEWTNWNEARLVGADGASKRLVAGQKISNPKPTIKPRVAKKEVDND